MNKMILMAPAIAAGMLIAGCGAEPRTVDDVAAPPPSGPAAESVTTAVAASAIVPAPYAMADDAPKSGRCSLDAVNGKRGNPQTLKAAGSAMFGGWAANDAKQPPTGALFVLGNGADSHAVSLVVGAERPDVAKALGSEALAQAGFNLLVALDGIPAGSYNLVVVLDPVTSAYCDLKTTLVLE